MRALGWLLGLALVAGSAHAQVFKPRNGASKTTDKKKPAADKADKSDAKPDKADKKAATSKKATRAGGATARRVTTKPKKGSRAARDSGRPDDLTPEPTKNVDPDFVNIIDDDE